MKDSIKKQEEIFERLLQRYAVYIESNRSEDIYIEEEIKAFITKVRKETAEYVCDRMIGEKLDENCKYDQGHNVRIEIEKEIKQQIIESL